MPLLLKVRKLPCEVNEHVLAPEAWGVTTTKNDPLTAHLVADKLDSESKRRWELDSSGTKLQTLDELLEFVDQRARAFEACQNLRKVQIPRRHDNFERALQLQKRITQQLSTAGFNFRKWSSNSSEFMSASCRLTQLTQESKHRGVGYQVDSDQRSLQVHD